MITFNTLKKYARRGHLKHWVTGEFDGMVDGVIHKDIRDIDPKKTTLDDLKKFKATKNYITITPSGRFMLSNCIYTVHFMVEA